MKKLLILLLFPFLSFSQVMYISPSGSDISGLGTFSNPFLTVQNAIDNGASEILLLEGIYTNSEQITGSNIVIKPNLDDNVVYDGTMTINEPGNVSAFWTQHKGNIYKTEINQPIWQVFIDDVEMVMARWPNSTFEEDLIYNKEDWAHSEPEDIDGVVNDITDISLLYNESKNLSDFNNSDIDGAILIANFGSFKTKVKQVLSTGLDLPNSKFEYTEGECEEAQCEQDLDNDGICEDHCEEIFMTVVVDCECSFFNPNTYTVFFSTVYEESCELWEDCYCECYNDTDGDGICDEDDCVAELIPDCVFGAFVDPVCGCDGVTYSNYGEAACNNIFNFTMGECDEENVIIEELFNNQKLLKIIDFLGREINSNTKFQSHIYDDGSVEKKYIIE